MEIDSKNYTSSVEDTRETFEEPVTSKGRVLRIEQIWRDSNLIPETAPELPTLTTYDSPTGGTYGYAIVYTFRDGATVNNLLSYYDGLVLKRVAGTDGCYHAAKLANIITQDFGDTYIPKIYIGGTKLAYGIGLPEFDIASGILRFNDRDFLAGLNGRTVSVSFYRYEGRAGAFSSENLNPDLPFRDTLIHFKNAENDSQTATFKVRGDVKATNYVLPAENGKWYDKGTEADTGVVLLQENLEDTLWEQDTKISGGCWRLTSSGGTKVFRYYGNKVNGQTVDEGEDK